MDKGSLSSSPMVSVIVPNYNYARYMDERMQSILNQTYQNFEIIILDDCSTDNSKEVIENYRYNEHVTNIVYNTKNSGGVFKQWQKGFSLANGELIWIAEADDKCKPTQLEKLVNEFEKDHDLALAFVRTVSFNDQDGSQSILMGEIKKSGTRHYNGIEFIKKFMQHSSYVTNASSTLFKKRVLAQISNEYTSFKASGDRLFWIEVSQCGNVAIVDEALNYCRRHGNNVTETAHSMKEGLVVTERKKIQDYLRSHHFISKWNYNKIASEIIYFDILNNSHLDVEVKENLLKTWNYNAFKKFLIWLLKIRMKFNNPNCQ